MILACDVRCCLAMETRMSFVLGHRICSGKLLGLCLLHWVAWVVLVGLVLWVDLICMSCVSRIKLPWYDNSDGYVTLWWWAEWKAKSGIASGICTSWCKALLSEQTGHYLRRRGMRRQKWEERWDFKRQQAAGAGTWEPTHEWLSVLGTPQFPWMPL